jgi:hypothetical protein
MLNTPRTRSLTMSVTTMTSLLLAMTALLSAGENQDSDDSSATDAPAEATSPSHGHEWYLKQSPHTPKHSLRTIDIDPLISPDPFDWMYQSRLAFNDDVLAKVNLSFDPQAVYYVQHATEVKPGENQTKSIFWVGGKGTFPIQHVDGTLDQVVFVIQSTTAIGELQMPPLSERMGSPEGLDNIQTGDGFNFTDVYWQHEWANNTARLFLGKMNPAPFFDRNAIAGDPNSQYIAVPFCMSPVVPYPGHTATAILGVDLNESWTVRAAASNLLGSTASTGFQDLDEGRFLWQGQVEWHTLKDDPLAASYRLHGWYADAAGGGGGGIGINLDKKVCDQVTIFSRAGIGSDRTAISTQSVTGGFQIDNFLGRKRDALGVAVGWSDIPDRFGPDLDGNEFLAEVYWRINVTETLQISPDIMYFHKPDQGIDGSIIWNLRFTWNF